MAIWVDSSRFFRSELARPRSATRWPSSPLTVCSSSLTACNSSLEVSSSSLADWSSSLIDWYSSLEDFSSSLVLSSSSMVVCSRSLVILRSASSRWTWSSVDFDGSPAWLPGAAGPASWNSTRRAPASSALEIGSTIRLIATAEPSLPILTLWASARADWETALCSAVRRSSRRSRCTRFSKLRVAAPLAGSRKRPVRPEKCRTS